MPDTQVPASPADRLHARYGTPGHEAAAHWGPVVDSVLAHRSVRAFLPDGLAPGTLETLVAAAQSAATSSNLQAWSVVAVEDPDRKARLSAMAGDQRHIRDAPLFLLWIADLSRATVLGQARGRELPTADYLEMFLVAVIDAALAAQNAAVAAESIGLGTVYIGGMRNRPVEAAAELGLPPGAFVVFGLCVGHPDPARPASVKPRLPQATVLHRERYDLGAATDVGAYDAGLQAFQQAQGMKPQGWTDLVMNRMGRIEAMSGRHTLRQSLETLGFRLL